MTTGSDRIPKIDSKHIITNRGKQYILYAGLLDAAHAMGLAGMTTTIVQLPSKAAGIENTIVHATATMPWGQFDGFGEVAPNDTNPVAKANPIRMAETRAKARALRDAINASEYEVDDVDGSPVDRETGEITRSTAQAPARETPSGAGRRPAGPGPYEPGGAAGTPLEQIKQEAAAKAIYPGARVATDSNQRRWNALVAEALATGHFTTETDEAEITGKALIPAFSNEQWDDATSIVGEGRKLRALVDEAKKGAGG